MSCSAGAPQGARVDDEFNMRVRSWLRINAGGVPNTCKSNAKVEQSMSRVANG